MYVHIYIYMCTYIYAVREGGCDCLRAYLFMRMYAILLSQAWDHVGSQDKIRKRTEGLKLKSKSYFI